MLIGDSNGSMYGTALRKLAHDLQYKLTVLSVAAGDPLPTGDGKQHGNLWFDSLAAVKNGKPTVVMLVCNWVSKLSVEKDRIRLAIEALSPHTQQMILLTMPPTLPKNASREAIRNGAKPPFFEDVELCDKRREMNQFVKSFQSDKVKVLDVESLFSQTDGSIRFTDDKGRLIYQDSNHISHYGAALVMPILRKAIEEPSPATPHSALLSH